MVPPFAFAHWVQQFAWLYMPLPDPTHPKSGLPGHAVPCANTRPRYSRGPDSPPSWSANPGAGDLCWLTSGSGASGREEDSGACCVDSACSNGEGGGDREVVPETTTLQRITQLSARRILRGCKPAASTARSARRAQQGKFRELSSGRFCGPETSSCTAATCPLLNQPQRGSELPYALYPRTHCPQSPCLYPRLSLLHPAPPTPHTVRRA